MASHRFTLGLLAVVFALCVLGGAWLGATNAVFGARQTVKQSLEEGHIYDSVANQIVEAASRHAEEQSEQQEASLNNAIVQEVAKEVITGQRIQGYGEQIVDGIYNWLEGDTETPDFAVDLAPLKQDFAVAAAETGVQRAQGLPVCTAEQLQQIDLNNIDLFSLPCLPPGFDLAAEQQKIIAEATASQEILQDTSVHAEEASNPASEEPFEKLSYVPTIFQWSKILPWILGVTGIAAGLGIVFLNSDQRQGLKKVAKILLICGIVLLVSTGLVSLLFSKIRPNPEVAKVIDLRDSVLIVVTSLGSAVSRILLIFAVGYAAIGGGGLIGLRFLKPQSATTVAQRQTGKTRK